MKKTNNRQTNTLTKELSASGNHWRTVPLLLIMVGLVAAAGGYFGLISQVERQIIGTSVSAQVAGEQARMSDAFVETIGIGGRWDHALCDNRFPALRTALQKSRIRYIRAGVLGELNCTSQETYNAELRQMALDLNVKIVGNVGWDNPEWTRAGVECLGDRLYALEGVNESFGPPDWAWEGWQSGTAVDVQKFVWELGRSKNLDVYS